MLAQDDETDIDIPPEQAILKYNNTCNSAVRLCCYRIMDPKKPYSPSACIDQLDTHYCHELQEVQLSHQLQEVPACDT